MQLDQPNGKNNGTVGLITYFRSKPNHGTIFWSVLGTCIGVSAVLVAPLVFLRSLTLLLFTTGTFVRRARLQKIESRPATPGHQSPARRAQECVAIAFQRALLVGRTFSLRLK